MENMTNTSLPSTARHQHCAAGCRVRRAVGRQRVPLPALAQASWCAILWALRPKQPQLNGTKAQRTLLSYSAEGCNAAQEGGERRSYSHTRLLAGKAPVRSLSLSLPTCWWLYQSYGRQRRAHLLFAFTLIETGCNAGAFLAVLGSETSQPAYSRLVAPQITKLERIKVNRWCVGNGA